MDDTTKFFFSSIMEFRALASFYEFENEGFFSAGQGHMVRFALLTMAGVRNTVAAADFLFQGKSIADLKDNARHIPLKHEDIRLLNPNTGTCPIFRTRRDFEITANIYRRFPVLIREGKTEENPWSIQLATMFHMSNDSHLFNTYDHLNSRGCTLVGNIFRGDGDRHLPLYEAKMVYQFDHRHGDYGLLSPGQSSHVLPEPPVSKLRDSNYRVLPRYWVPEATVKQWMHAHWKRSWLFGWREITDARASARTVVAAVIPPVAAGNKILFILPASPEIAASLLATLDSFVFDYSARQKLGGISLSYYIMKQLPVPAPADFESPAPWSQRETLYDWLRPRIIELIYTASDLTGFARDLGYNGEPFQWDDERRFALRSEIDAAFFQLYGLTRQDVDYVLDTFPIVRSRDEERFGEYRTKRAILGIYDEMEQAKLTGRVYKTGLDPSPGDPRAAHQGKGPTIATPSENP